MGVSQSQCIGLGGSIVLSIVLFFLGFMANRLLADRTANRNEDRSLLNNISCLVNDIQTKADIYYSLSAVDKEAIRIATEIRSLIRQIARQVQLFSNHYPNRMVLMNRVVKLRQAVTLQLDDSTRTALPDSSPVLGDISDKSRILIGELELLYSNKYREVKKGFSF